MDTDEETIIYFNLNSPAAYAEIESAQSDSDSDSERDSVSEEGQHFILFEVQEGSENSENSGSDSFVNENSDSQSISEISEYSSFSYSSSSSLTDSSSSGIVATRKRCRQLQSSSDSSNMSTVDEELVEAKRSRQVACSYSTHSVRREKLSPVGDLEVDVRDKADVLGEARCKTPSPGRNGYYFDPNSEEMLLGSRYERKEVEFFWRRCNTVNKRHLAHQEEVEGEDRFGYKISKAKPDSSTSNE